MDQYFAETGRKHMSRLLIASITNVWHQELSLESPSYSVVNTFWFSPVTLQERKVDEHMSQSDKNFEVYF